MTTSDTEYFRQQARQQTADATERRARLERIKRIERIVLLPILTIAAIAFVTIGRIQVVGESMEPTYKNGRRLMILKQVDLLGALKPGDVVIVGKGSGAGRDEEVIKRVVFVQDAEGSRPWPATVPTTVGPLPPSVLFQDTIGAPAAPNTVYVLGDNFNNSTDSRYFGAIKKSELLGKVLF